MAASVIDQAVDHLDGLVDLGNGGLDHFFVTNVAGEADGLAPVFFDLCRHAIQFFLLAANQHHAGTQGSQFMGGTATDAGAAAGDDNVLAGKQVGFEYGTV